MICADTLHRHRAVWREKPLLRMLYGQWYKEIAAHLRSGPTVELGGGSGNLKEYLPQAICTDIVLVPWVDAVADSRHLPFGSATVTNLVLFDVLHHIDFPSLFFDEALRILVPQGRLIVMDPYMSWLSWPIYYFLHPEPVDLKANPLALATGELDRTSTYANQAVATILFERCLEAFRLSYPQLEVLAIRRLAYFAYPLSGGFEHPSLIPVAWLRPLLALERRLSVLARLLAFRILVVLEKKI